eukprot:TRINITY_DN79015_c0_g1_i1.p1 TRINITY_DN79015_c0_g1~~TRINITY_DN79015_c0_g1_i1.p1  ORF type:complete len:364 (-),score=57.83 TRINITY_DN79015_c0_g1_i1:128-1219(-)
MSSGSEPIDNHIMRKYEVSQKIGKGAYGIVWKAVDKKTRDVVALKKIFDAFQNATDSQRTFREVMFLQQLGEHENIISLHNVMKAENDKDIYLVFEYMETDLHQVIRHNILEDIHKQYIIYQLIKALKWLHTAGVVHRDIKPSNVLLNSECHLKLADFGLARSITQIQETNGTLYTEYIATRWYRAPEILLGSQKYDKAVDMWSVGCIIGELLGGKAMFPGTSTINQLEKICQCVGMPKKDDIEVINSKFASTMAESIPKASRKNFQDLYPKAPAEALDLMDKLLTFNHKKRYTWEQSLEHPYVSQFHDEETEPIFTGEISLPIDDNHKFSIQEYRNSLYEDIRKRKKEQRMKARKLNEMSQN